MAGRMITNLGAIVIVKHRADVILAKDGNGLQLTDDGGNLGITVADGGNVLIGTAEAVGIAGQLQVFGTTFAAITLRDTDNDTEGMLYQYSGGMIVGCYSQHDLYLRTNNTNRVFIDKTQALVCINETANASMTVGLTINQGANDDEILAFKSSDVAHGATSITEADSYASFKKVSAGSGGLLFQAFGGGVSAVQFNLYATSDNTTKSSAGYGPAHFKIMKIAGGVGGAVGANANLLSIANNTSTKWILDEDGDTWQSGGAIITGHVCIGEDKSPGAALEVTENSTYNSESSAGLRITEGTSDVGVLLGADKTNNIAYIQALDPATSYATRPLALMPNGGMVVLGGYGTFTNANMNTGLTISQGANDDEILAFKSSDVAHGITSLGETDTFAYFKKAASASGGLRIDGVTEATRAIDLVGSCTSEDTTKTTGSAGCITLWAQTKTGTTVTNMGANANVLAVRNYDTSVLLLDEDGDLYIGGSLYSLGDVDTYIAFPGSDQIYFYSGGSALVLINTEGLKLADSMSINIDSAPSSDHKASGITCEKTAGENVVFGEVCYMKSDGKLWKCDADAAASVIGLYMALETVNADTTGTFLKQGWVRDDSWAWTVGSRLYCSTTAGDMTHTAPAGSGDAVVCVGWAEGADYVAFFPDCTIVEVA